MLAPPLGGGGEPQQPSLGFIALGSNDGGRHPGQDFTHGRLTPGHRTRLVDHDDIQLVCPLEGGGAAEQDP